MITVAVELKRVADDIRVIMAIQKEEKGKKQ
jgi:hypothetical protein